MSYFKEVFAEDVDAIELLARILVELKLLNMRFEEVHDTKIVEVDIIEGIEE